MNPKIGMIGGCKEFIGLGDNDTRATFGTERGREYIVLLLGAKPKKDNPPSEDQLDGILLNLGYVPTDQIVDILGQKAAEDLVDKASQKLNEKLKL